MEANDEQYWECPKCGFIISFTLKGNKYVSYCPFCGNRLEIDKDEYENEENDGLERYFEFE